MKMTQSKLKQKSRKFDISLSSTIATNSIVTQNPEINSYLCKFNQIDKSIELTQTLNKFNMIKWQAKKYIPKQSQNRIRVQNKIAIMKIANQNFRPREKKIKKFSTQQSQVKEFDIPYKQLYLNILQAKQKTRRKSIDSASEIQQYEHENSNNQKIKFYDKLKRYEKFTNYLVQKIEQKESIATARKQKLKLKLNQTANNIKNQSKSVPIKKSRVVKFREQRINQKIQDIFRKWSPESKQYGFESSASKKKKSTKEQNHQNNLIKLKQIRQTILTASRIPSKIHTRYDLAQNSYRKKKI